MKRERALAAGALALLLLGSAVPAAAVPTVDALLDRHARAQGLSREEADPRCEHSVARLDAFGLQGRLETWSQAPLFVRSRLELGPLTLQTWFDGESGWIADRNGAHRPAEGPELEALQQEALVATGAYVLQHPPVPLRRWTVEEDGDSSTIELRIQPLLGEAQTLILDAETFLLRGTRFDAGQGEQVARILDFLEADGRQVVRRAELSLGPQMTVLSELVEHEWIDARPADFYRPGTVLMPQDLRFERRDRPVELALEGDGLHLLVHGRITPGDAADPREGLFLVDTGAGANVIDRTLAEEMGLRPEGRIPAQGVGGSADAGFVHLRRVDLGGLHLLDQSWVSVDLSDVAAWFDRPLLGVLGYDLLERVILDVDYPEGVLRIWPHDAWHAPEDASEIALRMDANVPSVRARIEGIDGWLHVDTGSNGGLDLSNRFVHEHALLDGRATQDSGGLLGVGGRSETRSGVVEHLELGGFILENVPTGFHEAEDGLFAVAKISGIVGAQVLSRWRCVFDYRGRRAWFIAPAAGPEGSGEEGP